MPEIEITLDADGLLESRDDVSAMQIRSTVDYVAACVALRQALHSRDGALHLMVRNRAAGVWLASFAQDFGRRINVRRYTPRDALHDRWGVDVPAHVTDEQIRQAGLLRVFAKLILTHPGRKR